MGETYGEGKNHMASFSSSILSVTEEEESLLGYPR